MLLPNFCLGILVSLSVSSFLYFPVPPRCWPPTVHIPSCCLLPEPDLTCASDRSERSLLYISSFFCSSTHLCPELFWVRLSCNTCLELNPQQETNDLSRAGGKRRILCLAHNRCLSNSCGMNGSSETPLIQRDTLGPLPPHPACSPEHHTLIPVAASTADLGMGCSLLLQAWAELETFPLAPTAQLKLAGTFKGTTSVF